ncbi:MAG: 16S rRNA (cytosine(1402)-N(4))-methyltransferase RsmH [Candidatus Omnitrophota bacterium]|nr:MAG: 16S rRNA (cytosine(1402)-N(4))-methyltransferase RsmH [Candidatus Omnitrophota bacterium]
MEELWHYPVLYREVLELLAINRRKLIVDCTIGVGSLALKFFEAMKPDAFLIGIDKDGESLEVARRNLGPFEGRFVLRKSDFFNVAGVLKDLGILGVDALIFDLGISTYQLSSTERGFSFLKEGPLDMRMDKDAFVSAYDLVNNLSVGELTRIFKKFGEERYAKKIAHFIVQARRRAPISSTTELAGVVMQAFPPKKRYGRIHPATRIFQALRIAVNRELEVLGESIEIATSLLNKGGRIGVISFHSLEDRIVKHTFKNLASSHVLEIITKKPVSPTLGEIEENSASRCAKLRVAEKL